MKKIRWGIIGPGKIARKFASDISHAEFAELSAIASTSIDRAKAMADEFNIESYYGEYYQLYNDNNIDAVYIATPNNLHFRNSMDAMLQGKAVLCEKPLTCNSKDTGKLIKFAQKNEIYLMEAMWTYFLPAIIKAKQWIDKGLIGDIKHIKADFGFKANYNPESRIFNPQLGGGSILDIGIYPIALAWYIIRKDPAKINRFIKYSPSGVDMDVVMHFKYDGQVAQLGSSFEVDLPNHAIIVGTEGYIDIPNFWKSHSCFLYKRDKIIEEFKDERKSFGLNFEIDAVSLDLLSNKFQSEVVSHDTSLKIAQHIDRVLDVRQLR